MLSPRQIVERDGLAQVSDPVAIGTFVDHALEANPQAVADYRVGKMAALNRLVGETMKASHGKGNPRLVREILLQRLGR